MLRITGPTGLVIPVSMPVCCGICGHGGEVKMLIQNQDFPISHMRGVTSCSSCSLPIVVEVLMTDQ